MALRAATRLAQMSTRQDRVERAPSARETALARQCGRFPGRMFHGRRTALVWAW